jgi:hypothetical protein
MTAPVEKLSKDELLDRFHAKAGCYHTQREARSVWRYLSPQLTREQQAKLLVAWGHAAGISNTDRSELDGVCQAIRWGAL